MKTAIELHLKTIESCFHPHHKSPSSKHFSNRIPFTTISNNSFSFSRKKFRIKRRYVSTSQLTQAKSEHKPPIAHKAKNQVMPGTNNKLHSPAKNIKIFPRATYNFLSNLQRFEYQPTSKSNAVFTPATEGNHPIKKAIANISHYYQHKQGDYQKARKQMNESIGKETLFDLNDKENGSNANLLTETMLIISSNQGNQRPHSAGIAKGNKMAHFFKFLNKVNSEVFEVLPSKEIVSVFVSKSSKGFPSMKNHVPGPTYYTPKLIKPRSFYLNTKKIWV